MLEDQPLFYLGFVLFWVSASVSLSQIHPNRGKFIGIGAKKNYHSKALRPNERQELLM